MNNLDMVCSKCKIAECCPKKGSSPLVIPGKKPEMCQLVNGYGRDPISDDKLSEESKQLVDKQGRCLSIAEIPVLDEHTGKIYREIVKIFHQPILHPREKTNWQLDMIYPRSHR